tara:strand:- start:3442 stop:3570 length:129 start_codon:yes stop_codon:yes gene_type:complete
MPREAPVFATEAILPKNPWAGPKISDPKEKPKKRRGRPPKNK